MLRAMTTSKLSVRGIERKTARVLSAGHTETISNSIMLVSALVLALEVSLLCSPDHAALMQSDVRHLLYIKAVQGIGEYEERMPKEDSLGLFGSSLFPSSFFLRRAYFAIVCHLAAICIGCGLHLAILFFRAQQIEDTNTLKLSKTFFVWTIALMLALMFAGNVGFFCLSQPTWRSSGLAMPAWRLPTATRHRRWWRSPTTPTGAWALKLPAGRTLLQAWR